MIKRKEYYIYKATNKTNGKVYVGKTYDFEKRKREHIYDIDDNSPFHRALKKYGIKNFLWEIIDIAYTQDDIQKKEVYWIKRLNSWIKADNSNGYNVTLGGEGGISWNSRKVKQFTLSGEFLREYHSCAEADTLNGMYRGAAQYGCSGQRNNVQGYQWRYSDECPENKIQPYVRESEKRKRIVQLDKDGTEIKRFSSITEAAKELNIGRTGISACLTGKTKSCVGYFWKYEKSIQNQ